LVEDPTVSGPAQGPHPTLSKMATDDMRRKIEDHLAESDNPVVVDTTDVHPTTTDRHHLHRPVIDDQTGVTASTHDKATSPHHPVKADTHSQTSLATVAQREATSDEEAALQLAAMSTYQATMRVIRDGHENLMMADNDVGRATLAILETGHRMREEQAQRIAIERETVEDREIRGILGGREERVGLDRGVLSDAIGIATTGTTTFIGGGKDDEKIGIYLDSISTGDRCDGWLEQMGPIGYYFTCTQYCNWRLTGKEHVEFVAFHWRTLHSWQDQPLDTMHS
jgi:hypothetical protein